MAGWYLMPHKYHLALHFWHWHCHSHRYCLLMLKGGGGLQRWWQWAMTWAKTVEIDGGWWRATRWVITWAMMWAITMAGLMVDNGGVDGGRWKRGHWWCCFVWSWENLQPELLARKSRHYLILPTTFVTVSIVHIVGIIRVHIWDPTKPWGMTYLYFVLISQVDPVEMSMHTKGFRFKKCTLATAGTNNAYLNHR